MRRLSAAIMAIALLAGLASMGAAANKYPPGPPYRSCPDTLTLFDIQQSDTTIAPCHPATLDTVLGIQGIVTGFDLRASSFAFYIQAASGNPYTGLDGFSGATNYNGSVPGSAGSNLQLGDLVAVYGRTQEFPAANGETEIEGFDGIQSSNDLIVRRISAGNPLPPFKVGTTHDFNWIPASPGNLGEQYEGMLVKIRGPLRVGRIGPGASNDGLFGNNWLVVSVAAPSPDSVMIDGFTLPVSPVGTPAVGTVIDSIQGILNQRDGDGVNSYRIQIRNGNDMFLAAPPNMVEAFPIEDNVIRLSFDRNVDVATAENEGNYSLGSGIDGSTVDNATVVGGSGQVVDLTITSVLVDGVTETITSSGIGAATCPTCLSSSATLTFINGVLNVDDLQAPFPDSLAFLANRPIYESAGNPVTLSPCVDRSRFAGPGTAFGPRLTFRGVHTQSYGSLYYVQRPQPGGQRRGISVFGPSTALTVGHRYKIAGRVQEFGGETEIVNTVYIVDEGPDAIPFPIQKPISVLANQTCDQAQNIETGEDYEGVLVKVSQARVVNFNTDPVDPSAGGSFRIVQPLVAATDTILVSSLGNHYTYDPTAGDIVDVTGILHEDGTFRILPRSDADIARGSAGVGGGQFDLALSVAPNPGIAHHIDFALPTKSAVELGVFDLAGRRVAVIASGVMEAGPHSATWNGLASNGSRAGAGMYFYRLKVGNELRTLRAVKLN